MMKRATSIVFWTAIFAMATLSATAFLARFSQPFEIFSNFRLQFAVAALALFLMSPLLRSVRATAAAAALALLNGATILAPLAQHAPTATSSQAKTRIIWVNLQRHPEALRAVAALARAERADIVALTELPPGGGGAIREAFPDFACLPWSDESFPPFFTVIVARQSCAQRTIPLPPSVIKAAEVGDLSVVAIHARPPWNNARTASRNQVIAAGAAAAVHGVLLGDFNVAPWSPALIDVSREGLRRAHCGAPFTPTWASANPLLGLTIDHVFVAEGLAISQCRRGPAIWSDHWPLIVDVVTLHPRKII